MLNENVISKKDYDLKMKQISQNIKTIEESYENGPEAISNLERNLGLFSEIKEVQNLAEMSGKQ